MPTKHFLFILLFGLFQVPGFSQTNEVLLDKKDVYQQKGDRFFDRYEYKRALYFYNLSYEADTSNTDVLLKMADACSRLELSKQAEEYYEIAFTQKTDIENEYLLNYALTLLVNEKFNESRIWLEKYNQSVESDIRGKEYLNSIEKREELYKDSTIFIVRNLKEINTKESEINPVAYNNQLIYAAIRSNAIDPISTNYYDLYSSSFTPSGQLIKTSYFNTSLNSSLHEGPICLNQANSELFITRNITENSDKTKINLGIFKTALPKDEDEKLVLTPVTIQDFKYDIGHPALSKNGSEIYFISDSRDSFGGPDIFRSTLVNGQWSFPENLGNEVNTKGNEMFPFLYNDSVLYFSSDGHGGLGGLDIFKVNLTKKPLQLINLGYPVNSSSDDFSLFMKQEGEIGYFSSNRPSGAGSDDIYKVEFLNFKIRGSLLDAQNSALIDDAEISLILENGNERTIAKSAEGNFEFSIIPGESYTLVIEKENYKAAEIFLDENMTMELRKQMMIELNPVQKNEIKLEAGQKYNFSFGNDSTSNEYKKKLDDILSNSTGEIDSISDITLLAKELNISKDDNFSLHLIKDNPADSALLSSQETVMLFNSDTLVVSDDSILISLPSDENNNFLLQSDADFINKDLLTGENSVLLDKEPLLPGSSVVINPDEEQALKELEMLMSLSINTNASFEEDSTIKNITANGFSIIPQSYYVLTVKKKGASGTVVDEMNIPLIKGVKYDFSSKPEVNSNYKTILDAFLAGRQDVKIDDAIAIDISLLSKELKIEEGEEFAFSIMPDTTVPEELGIGKHAGSTIVLEDRAFDIAGNEKFQINVPYNPERKINIQTNIDYLQENFAAGSFTVNVDTIPFFGEIAIDTNGLYKRFIDEENPVNVKEQDEALKEIEWLLSLSINTYASSESDSTIRNITSGGFSIIPQSSYELTVSKKDTSGNMEDQMTIPLTMGVKYNFSSNPDANYGFRDMLDKVLESKQTIKSDESVAINISVLSKDLEIKKGEEFAFSIMPDSASLETIKLNRKQAGSTIILEDRTFNINSSEKFQINVPYNPDRKVNIQTDLAYLDENFATTNYNATIDTIPFFGEIAIDTNGLYMRFLDEDTTNNIINQDEGEALKALEMLMSLSVNTTSTAKEDPAIKNITSNGFSIIPQSSYVLTVKKKGTTGNLVDELTIPLIKGVKYDFSPRPETNAGYKAILDTFLSGRKDIKIDDAVAIDISLLSKELKIEEGEEFTFSILPDTTVPEEIVSNNPLGTTIVLEDKAFDIRSNEKFQINVPYNPERTVNIQTNIAYLQENFAAGSFNVNVDTVPFFGEIAIDTNGLYKRFIDEETSKTNLTGPTEDQAVKELEWLLSLSINTQTEAKKDLTIRNISAKGFSIVPQSTYILTVSKKGVTGSVEDQMTIPLTQGVKYDFTSNPDATDGYSKMVEKFLENRKDVKIDEAIAIDISLLSKELKINEGEEFAFSIMPDTTGISDRPNGEPAGSTIFLDDRTIDIGINEKFEINVPFNPERTVNIQTNLAYLQENFDAGSFNVNVDTIAFFGEIAIDTNGLYKQRMEEFTQMSKPDMHDFNKINPDNVTYRVQIAALRKPVTEEVLNEIYSGNHTVKMFEEDGYYKYYIAETPTYFEAKIILDDCGVEDAFIAAYEENIRISLKNAILRQYMERMSGIGITLKDSVINVVMLNFEFDKYTLRPNDEFYLSELILNELSKNPLNYLVINGHTDIRGSKSYNYTLAEERAKFVKALLLQKGVSKDKIKTFSFGEDQVLKACDTPETCDESTHQVNRRVEIIVFATKK